MHLISLNTHNNLWGKYIISILIMRKQVQRGQVTCLQTHSKWQPGFETRSPWHLHPSFYPVILTTTSQENHFLRNWKPGLQLRFLLVHLWYQVVMQKGVVTVTTNKEERQGSWCVLWIYSLTGKTKSKKIIQVRRQLKCVSVLSPNYPKVNTMDSFIKILPCCHIFSYDGFLNAHVNCLGLTVSPFVV